MRKNHAMTVWLFFILTASAFAQEPRLKWVTRVQPVYPQMARIAHIEGEVWMEIELDPQGTIVNLLPLSGHPILVQAADDSLRRSKFACENCGEGSAFFSLVIRFKMDDPPRATSAPCPATNEGSPTGTGAAARKRRVARCLYLWRCAAR